ncbi:putative retrotransposon hot spot protein 4 (RHS4) [Trypanosoma vivax]|nr:putative retrotransposon hot spot protein 4 (RHS4) [Trypanosoma vivax]
MTRQVVFYKKADNAVSACGTWRMGGKRRWSNERRLRVWRTRHRTAARSVASSFFDVGGKYRHGLGLPTPELGCVVLSSPSERNYKGWKKHNEAYYIFINCYTALEIKAFFAWQQRALLDAAANDAGARADIDALWREVELRVDEVCPLPLYVFDNKSYKGRCNPIADKLKNIIEQNAEHYMKILMGNEEWIEKGTTHAVIKIA